MRGLPRGHVNHRPSICSVLEHRYPTLCMDGSFLLGILQGHGKPRWHRAQRRWTSCSSGCVQVVADLAIQSSQAIIVMLLPILQLSAFGFENPCHDMGSDMSEKHAT